MCFPRSIADGEETTLGMLADGDCANARFGERRAERPRDARQAAEVAARMGRDLGEALR